MVKLAEFRKSAAGSLTQPVVQFLAKTHITPNTVTWIGFCLSVVAAVIAATGNLLFAGLVMLAGGFLDMLDGALARLTNQTTKFGGILDSTLDRLAEAAVFIGILVYYVMNSNERPLAGVLLAGLALAGSFMVSYVRARAEGAGLESETGVFTRPERVIVLALGLLLGSFSFVLTAALAIIIFFSFLTTVQRLVDAWRKTKGN
ncbi:MAG: CDP-alcohol phosphatidyltransferase family protein [Dehalococcoidales bacterium]|nr:CDP-alcohol phosphatidyltransferase family protein [Dehalococcoidales bacterium]